MSQFESHTQKLRFVVIYFTLYSAIDSLLSIIANNF